MTAEASVLKIAHCRGCGYLLRGLASNGACPECGKAFDLADPKSWTRHPRKGRIWRRMRWPLAVVMVLILAAGSGPGWLYWGWRQEQPAIRWEGCWEFEMERIGPEWLNRRAGRWGWMLERAVGIVVQLDDSTEARELPRRLRWLKEVGVRGDGMTAEWLEELGKGRQLELLNLATGEMPPAILGRLGRQEKLEILILAAWSQPGSIPLPEDALAPLAAFPQLRRLILVRSDIQGSAMKHLRHVPRLEDLWLDQTQVGDEAMAAVGQCPELLDLSLEGTRITSAGIDSLAGLRKLTRLDLRNTAVDDSAIDTLISLPKLEWLLVKGTSMTAEGIERLREAMPQVEVMWSSQ